MLNIPLRPLGLFSRVVIFCFLALAAIGLLSACATTTTGGVTTTVVMTPAQLAVQANTVLTAFKSSVAAYAASSPGAIPADMSANITMAENAAGALIQSIGSADVSTAASDALAVANGLAAVANQIPGLPIEARAGLIAFQILVAELQPLVAPPVVASALGAMLPSTHAALSTIPAGAKVTVLLVPNT